MTTVEPLASTLTSPSIVNSGSPRRLSQHNNKDAHASFGDLQAASKTIANEPQEEEVDNESDKEQFDLKHSSKEYIAM